MFCLTIAACGHFEMSMCNAHVVPCAPCLGPVCCRLLWWRERGRLLTLREPPSCSPPRLGSICCRLRELDPAVGRVVGERVVEDPVGERAVRLQVVGERVLPARVEVDFPVEAVRHSDSRPGRGRVERSDFLLSAWREPCWRCPWSRAGLGSERELGPAQPTSFILAREVVAVGRVSPRPRAWHAARQLIS